MSKTATEHELLEKIKVLESEIKKLKKQKKYGLVWEDKPEEIVEDCKINVPILRLKEKSKTINPIITTDDSQDENILIEGDNYHALSVLNYTHKGKIDVIYIDPPYNTGSNDFIYNDKIVDKEDAFRHSKWVSFMEKRLEISRNLLSDKGVVFISIDDNEQSNLKLLCDGIFGSENFISTLIWQKKYSPQNDAKYFSNMHDFILVYAKKKNTSQDSNGWKINLLERSEEQNARYSNPDNDSRGPWKSSDLLVKTYSAKYDYEIITPVNRKVSPPKGRCWRISKEKYQEMVNDNRIWFGKNGDSIPSIKRFLSDVQQGIVPSSILFREDVGDNQEASQELKSVLGFIAFDNPKPTRLIKRLLDLSIKKDGSVLDFFAGSGTTGHAVLDLNKQDGGNRKFILCTNNENQICEEVTYERIKRVINGYENGKGEKVEGVGGNLRYYKTDLVNIEKLHNTPDQAKVKLTYQAGEMIGLKENTLTEVEKNDWWQIFESKNKTTAIYFKEDKEKLLELVDKLESKKQKAVLYIFSWGKNEYKSEYSSQYIKVEDIPEPILEVYKEINKI